MTERPQPPPWGVLITSALASEGISAREAARRAGISEGRWRQITGGYQVVSPGVYAHVRGPAATLAKMAAVAGVNPAQLRAAGRDDAAELLANRLDPSPAEDEMLERVKAMDRSQARELLATIALRLGISLADVDERAPDSGRSKYGTTG